MTDEDREWADDHGFQSGRCPNCWATMWSDTGVFDCEYCGWSESAVEDDDQD
jgi:hypothetical protein